MATLAGRPTSAYRPPISRKAATHQLHLGEQWPERPGVAQFLYLSALLHAMAILLFGAPPGGSPDGRAMWGSLNVVIRGPAKDIVIPERMEPIVASPLRKLEREFAPSRTIVTPQVVLPQKMERIAPPQVKLEKMLPSPKIEVVPLPAPAPPIAVPAPVAPIVPELPRVERTMAEPPKITAPVAQPVAPPVKERPPPPAEVPRVDTTLVPTLPVAPALPALERAPDIAPKIVAPPAPPVPEPVAPKVETPPAAPPAAPTSREELFAPRAPAPARPAPAAPAAEKRANDGAYDPTKPSIDLEEMRRRASQMAREGVGQRALLPFPMPAPPERKSKTEEALEKARKPDCRTAYKDLGLLAAVPLIANEFGEGTCRW
jgi:hypothetical protein